MPANPPATTAYMNAGEPNNRMIVDMILKSAPPVFSNIQSIKNTKIRMMGNVFSMETPEVKIIKIIAKASDKTASNTAGFLSKLIANIAIAANIEAGAFPLIADHNTAPIKGTRASGLGISLLRQSQIAHTINHAEKSTATSTVMVIVIYLLTLGVTV